MVLDALDFIKDAAETDVERKTAETLFAMIKENRVVFCESTEISGRTVYGAFAIDQKNGQPLIMLDLDLAVNCGRANLVDTIFHEAYHACQYFSGHKNDILAEEARAWTVGLEMSNKFRQEYDGFVVRTKPYTASEMLEMGYLPAGNPGVFSEV